MAAKGSEVSGSGIGGRRWRSGNIARLKPPGDARNSRQLSAPFRSARSALRLCDEGITSDRAAFASRRKRKAGSGYLCSPIRDATFIRDGMVPPRRREGQTQYFRDILFRYFADIILRKLEAEEKREEPLTQFFVLNQLNEKT
ncbi:Hypothetical protein NTJ_11390 [Nesidiocoris tenuis]|uniref:Uncharacterized protein n=1 Tax=Nesidiocoris tenuis TaxID=355587 RepID=A0ABN7B2C6_9HEMI|nr:Hypothetical protein NTJ_11390 [Nesidiocoris tenuis]